MNPRTKSQDIRDLSQNDIRELVAELGQPRLPREAAHRMGL